MSYGWWQELVARRSRGAQRRQQHAAEGRRNPLRLELLEDRTLLSVYAVDHLTDDGVGQGLAGDLRYCITNATSMIDVITFSVTGTINLQSALPVLETSVTIQGPGADNLTVRRDAGGDYPIFAVDVGATVVLSGLTIANGRATGD